MATGPNFLAFLLFYFTVNLQLKAVSASNLKVRFFTSQLNSQYTAYFIVEDCWYSSVSFYATETGGIPSTGLPKMTPQCNYPPVGAPAYISLLGSPSILQPKFHTSDVQFPYYACEKDEYTPGDGFLNFSCDPIVVVDPTTTTTTTTTSTTTTSTTTTTTTTTTTIPPTSTPTCALKTNIYGRKNGRGILKDCCKTSDDCYGSCKKGVCDSEHNPATTTSKNTSSTTTTTASPTPTGPCKNKSNVNGQKRGNGILGDCCRNSDDCTGTCIKGKCDAVGNPSGEKCISSNYYGKKNGQGPAGVCCKTEKDCKNSCVDGKCIK